MPGMSLTRFKEAQDVASGGFATALAELRAGGKRSHWIWYVFPQLAGLGRSSTARFYGLRDAAEARAYLADPLLRTRLEAVTAAVAAQLERGVTLTELMGGRTDALKVVSSLTLFSVVVCAESQPDAALGEFAGLCDRVLARANAQGFPRCPLTLAQLGDSG